MTPIFSIKVGGLSFADKVILSDIELYVSPMDKICLVGSNGCGKSSLMKIIFGEYELDGGEIYRDPAIEVGYLKQDMKLIPDSTIYDFVAKQFDEPDSQKYLIDMVFEQLQIDGNAHFKHCSGGQARRAFLAAALVKKPGILLLDEPTNHLDITAITWLEEYVKSYQGAIICISHDRAFQANVTNKVWWLDRGVLRKSSKGFKYYDQWREDIIAEEESVLRKMNRQLEVEKAWLGAGVTARRKRNQKRLANLHHLREKFRNHQDKLSHAKNKLKIELLEEAKKTKFIIEAEGVCFKYADKYILDDFGMKVQKGEKIGVIGPNGSGKSTLVKILTKELSPESGKIKHGTNLEITYFDQHRTMLNPNHSLQETLCPNGGDQIMLKNRTMHVAAYLKSFMFDPKALRSKVSTLSGGEANRLLLAKTLINPGNFLILDEPTNDLDMDSLEMLLEILADYDGTLLVVSHDRDFLERLVTRIIVFADDKITDLYGGYEDYLKFIQGKEGLKEKAKPAKQAEHKKVIAASAPNKLSYKYQRLLEVLPQEIDDLEKKIANIENELMAPDLYNANPKKFDQLSKDLIRNKQILEEKLQQWFEIESME